MRKHVTAFAWIGSGTVARTCFARFDSEATLALVLSLSVLCSCSVCNYISIPVTLVKKPSQQPRPKHRRACWKMPPKSSSRLANHLPSSRLLAHRGRRQHGARKDSLGAATASQPFCCKMDGWVRDIVCCKGNYSLPRGRFARQGQ